MCNTYLLLLFSYLAHGDSIKKNSCFFCIGKSTFCILIPEVCQILCNTLTPIFLPYPNVQRLREVADGFERILHMPNCVGALDGRHCPVKKPSNSGSLFYNYKHFFSVVLMGMCDAYRRFVWVNVGDLGMILSVLLYSIVKYLFL